MPQGTITVAEVIDEARDFDPSFDKIEQLQRVALRQVSRAERHLAKRVVEVDELALAEEVVFYGADVPLMQGIALGDHLALLEASYDVGDARHPLSLIGFTDRHTEGLRGIPSAYLVGNTLKLVDRTFAGWPETGWEDVDLIRVLLVKSPPRHVLDSECIGLPDVAYEALVANLAHWMALRVNHPKTSVLFAASQDAENALISNLATRGASSTWQVRVVDSY